MMPAPPAGAGQQALKNFYGERRFVGEKIAEQSRHERPPVFAGWPLN